jgi:hypothetical protein
MSSIMSSSNDTQNQSPSSNLESIAGEVLLRSLDQSTLPLTANQLRERLTGPYKLPLDKIETLLEELVRDGKVYLYPGSGPRGRSRFWTHGIEQFARETIRKTLATRSLPMSDLLRRLRNALKGMDETAQRRLITEMVREGALHEWPAVIGGRTVHFSAQLPEPLFYLEDALNKIARKLGRSRDSLASALKELAGANPEPSGGDEKLLERMVQMKLAAAQGAPLPLRDLWQSLQSEGWEKAAFDRVVIELAASYRVTLLKHNFPGMLSDGDRADLVVDTYGNHYVGIAMR